ncbi:hypothetical protein F2Q70_00011950 [Brassica cretica]|uniref:Uncharacterized protein n=1 Tax=Brassica cretica TaxID=69181 RepID=A0A3N6PNC4_BRACR|nr:hypothetical protein F2Q70_00011950 [Brassica cretica]KAF3546951.1 hypothetical protein DY000_02007567 [Brassica cretica]
MYVLLSFLKNIHNLWVRFSSQKSNQLALALVHHLKVVRSNRGGRRSTVDELCRSSFESDCRSAAGSWCRSMSDFLKQKGLGG